MSETVFEGFKVTRKGRALLAKLLAGETLVLSKVMAGSGCCSTAEEALELEDLLDPQVEGTSTVPVYDFDKVSMRVEFDSMKIQAEKGFVVREFGVYALDPDVGEILLHYYGLGDNGQYLFGVNSPSNNTLVYPVEIAVGEDMETVELGYPASAFVRHEEFVEHNVDPLAHPNLSQVILSATLPEDFGVGDVWWELPEGIVDSAVPELPEEETPEVPEVETPEVPEVETPEVPEVETPEVPEEDDYGEEVVQFDLVEETMPVNVVLEGYTWGVSNSEETTETVFSIRRK